MTYRGYLSIPDPEPTDPHLDLTAADVVAAVAQQLEVSGRSMTITPESFGTAESHAESLLAALGVSSGERSP
ncbi:hypothetical protein [Cryptosporangium sp. NPDC048952]|uniref:hypothetical protein n=1 Tax=Cryptosporangium sp. NPDC048952 TaxID=3363961 RepID=UPI003720A4EB